ncbi:Rex2 protein [Pichia kluyveri]|uniref:Rex2 protein n=1 Tax=Pichia kluyveri TaxID=36015 RepID=A0AAV5R7L1_PICKL|nr:Rex2 protein [Pichia kluyveri]
MLKKGISVASKVVKPSVNKSVKLSAAEIIAKAHSGPTYACKRPIVWIDCEMTGLDHHNDTILEICCLVTDEKLKVLDEGYEGVVHHEQSQLDAMNEWCIIHHGQSGVSARAREATTTKEDVERELLTYLQKHMPKGVGILAGNSVHMDRLFMLKDFPKVVEYLTYRIIDVSSVMEAARRFCPSILEDQPKKKGAHTAKEDIMDSIAQMAYFKDTLFTIPIKDTIKDKETVGDSSSPSSSKA